MINHYHRGFLVLSFCLLAGLAHADTDPAPVIIDPSLSQIDHGQSGRLTFVDENDYFVSHDDRHYTQGGHLSYLAGTDASDGLRDCDWLGIGWPLFEEGSCKRKYDWTIVGQSLFTPVSTNLLKAPKTERPYGAWLYTGISLLQEKQHDTHNTLDNFELLGGVVGPLALGGVTQNDFHQFIGDAPSRGWINEIHNEIGFVASEERKWRFAAPLVGNFGIDAIPEVGATLGNIFTYGEVGGLLRFGQNLAADYGPDRIRPSLSGDGWFDRDQLDGSFGWYFFGGTQGRVVGRNIFLDGNTFRSSADVNKKTIVVDFTGGLAIFWSDALRADFTITERTKEFYGQMGDNDRLGGVNVVLGF